MLGLLVPLVVILGTFSAIQYVRHEEAHREALALLAGQTSQAVENSLRDEMLTRNIRGLRNTLDAIALGEAIQSVTILDLTGRIVFAPGDEGVGRKLDNRDPTCQPCHSLPGSERPSSVIVDLEDGSRVFRSMNPIENQPECHACHDPGQRLNGLLLIDISMAPLNDPLYVDLRDHVFWPAATIVAVLLVTNAALGRLVLRPLETAARGLARFAGGQHNVQLDVGSADEIGQLATSFNAMAQRIQAEEEENRALSEKLRDQASARGELLKRVISAQEEERRRLARDLHDDLGQDLAGTAMHLEALERSWSQNPQAGIRALRKARELIAGATERVYDVILSLRPSALDDLGLAPALRAHATRVLEGKDVRFALREVNLDRRLPAEIETAVFRSFQEALGNALRHGRPKEIRVSLSRQGSTFEAEMSDDGQGFDLRSVTEKTDGRTRRGLGLLGMRERIEQCGGSLEVDSHPGAGTRLRIRIPIPDADSDR
ncbi:MAG TPA: sensor histidine kinase [Anaerolineales bacterium]|nr:sensor histidine kinase [Anaerolineales bacterium]